MKPVNKKGRQPSFGNKVILKRSLLAKAERNAGFISTGTAKIYRPTIPKLGMLYLAKECQSMGCLDVLIDKYEASLGDRMLITTKSDWESDISPTVENEQHET